MRIAGLIFFIFITLSNSAMAQPYKTIKVYKPYKWMFGIHWSIVEDDGTKFENIFNTATSWNLRPYPTKITVDRYIKYGMSMEAVVTYGQYVSKNIVNGETGLSGMILAADIHGKWSFYNLYAPKARWVEPYVTFGAGYTYRSVSRPAHTPTINLGGGVNFWIMENLGIQIASNAKFGLLPNFWSSPGNYLQHSFGVVYRTPDERSHKNQNDKKRYPWTKKNKRYKKKQGQ